MLNASADVVFQQNETTYDPASNVIFTAARSRLVGAGAATGDLVTSAGTLARSSFAQTWFDGIARSAAAADYGINGGAPMSAPVSPGPPPTASSVTCLVTSTTYSYIASGGSGTTGLLVQSTDPMGHVSQVQYDPAGRTVQTVQNFVANPTTSDQNVTVQTAYTPDGQVATLTALNSATGNQVTQYAYGTSAGTADSGVARTDLLKAVIYPSSTDSFTISGGVPVFSAVDNLVQYTYNQLGERVTMTDENGTAHAYAFDGLGRPTSDSVTHLGVNVDPTVQQIARSYEVRGMLQDVKSYGDSSGTGAIVNDAYLVYNDFGQLTAEYQSHSGAATVPSTSGGGQGGGGAGVSPAVQYSYSSGTANTIRPTSVTYPNGRTVTFAYNSGDDDNLSRVSYLSDTSGTLSQFNYLGLGRLVTEKYQNGATLDYTGGTAANYSGFDNFDRIAQQPWTGGAGTLLDQFNYTYDFNGNRLTRKNVKAAGLWDEQYVNDDVNRLYQSSRGSLSAAGTISGTPTFQENWGLDATGNWGSYSQSASGSLVLSQTRNHTSANELENIVVSGGTTSLAYDNAGNTTAMPLTPSGGTLALSGTCTYDAWSRLVATSSGTAGVACAFSYDGFERRLCKSTSASSTDCYLAGQQVVETRCTPSGGSATLQYQYVWSPRYIDAPVLRDDFTANPAYPRLFYLNDANFNVTSLSGSNGGIVERCVYGAYGTPTFYGALWTNASASSSVGNTTLYTGRELDPETGLCYYRARYYSANLGRFIGRDSAGFDAGDLNLYCYCDDNALDNVDPAGLDPQDHHWFPRFGGNGTVGQSYVDAKCNGKLSFKIDEFTTTMEASKEKLDAHWWITHVVPYNELAKFVYDNAPDCCRLLLGIDALREWCYVQMRVDTITPPAHELHHYQKPSMKTDGRFTTLIADACCDTQETEREKIKDKWKEDFWQELNHIPVSWVRYRRLHFPPGTVITPGFSTIEIDNRARRVQPVIIGLGITAIAAETAITGVGAAVGPVGVGVAGGGVTVGGTVGGTGAAQTAAAATAAGLSGTVVTPPSNQ